MTILYSNNLGKFSGLLGRLTVNLKKKKRDNGCYQSLSTIYQTAFEALALYIF